MTATKLQIALNTLASESCRDQADCDYVHARAAWRLRLRDQFLWASLQAIEKYLKGTLLFAGRSARYVDGQRLRGREFNHSLTALATAVESLPGIVTQHPSWLAEYLERLEHVGQNRYLTRNTYTRWDALERLDEAIWSVRRYCQHMNYMFRRSDGTEMYMLPAYLNTVNHPSYANRPHGLRLSGGQLEKWCDADRSNPTRAMLVWNNRFFGKRTRRTLRYVQWKSFANAPGRRQWTNEPTFRTELSKYFRLD